MLAGVVEVVEVMGEMMADVAGLGMAEKMTRGGEGEAPGTVTMTGEDGPGGDGGHGASDGKCDGDDGKSDGGDGKCDCCCR